ncbi:MAG: vWA domain-containing protein [Patescibacteria group bacterium]
MKDERMAAIDPMMSGEQINTSLETVELAERYRKRVEVGQVMLGGSGFGLRIDPTISTFTFDHVRREILISPSLIEGMAMSELEQDYLFFHEIGHFAQLAEDPDAYLEIFDLIKKRSQEAPDETREFIETAWKNFYNVFFDINDNAIVEARNPRFQKKQEGSNPRPGMYEKHVKSDMRGGPKYAQFNSAVLRRVMLPDAHVEIDEDVATVLEQPFVYLGKTHESFYEFARSFFDPSLPLRKFLSRLERTAKPIFERFLEEDIRTGKVKEIIDPIDLGDANPCSGEIKKMGEDMKRSREGGKGHAQRNADKRFSGKMAEAGFLKEEIDSMRKIRERADPVFPTLVDLWEVFFTITQIEQWETQSGYPSGKDVSIGEFIKQLPQFITAPDRLRIFLRDTSHAVSETIEPSKIDLSIALDLSGSMDRDKRRATQEAAYAIVMSLVQLKRNKDVASDDEEKMSSAIDINLRLVGFGTNAEELFLRSGRESQEQRIDIYSLDFEKRLWRALLDIEKTDMGGTQDAEALRLIQKEIELPENIEALKNQKAVSVIIEVTDGETATAKESGTIVRALHAIKGVHAKGIRIPGSLYQDLDPLVDEQGGHKAHHVPEIIEETGIFSDVWGKHGVRLDDISGLRSAMVKILSDLISQRESHS